MNLKAKSTVTFEYTNWFSVTDTHTREGFLERVLDFASLSSPAFIALGSFTVRVCYKTYHCTEPRTLVFPAVAAAKKEPKQKAGGYEQLCYYYHLILLITWSWSLQGINYFFGRPLGLTECAAL